MAPQRKRRVANINKAQEAILTELNWSRSFRRRLLMSDEAIRSVYYLVLLAEKAPVTKRSV